VQRKIVVGAIPHGVRHIPVAMVTQDAVFAVRQALRQKK
jgi:hypothetical protein